jgi:hypothetical protein
MLARQPSRKSHNQILSYVPKDERYRKLPAFSVFVKGDDALNPKYVACQA